jgi:hypothetical protein
MVDDLLVVFESQLNNLVGQMRSTPTQNLDESKYKSQSNREEKNIPDSMKSVMPQNGKNPFNIASGLSRL